MTHLKIFKIRFRVREFLVVPPLGVNQSLMRAGFTFLILRGDAPDEIVLAAGPQTELRIARADLVAMKPGAVSLMPQGYDAILTVQELADVIAFLKAAK